MAMWLCSGLPILEGGGTELTGRREEVTDGPIPSSHAWQLPFVGLLWILNLGVVGSGARLGDTKES